MMDLMDWASAILGFALIASIIGVIIYLYVRQKRNNWHTLLDYQRGIIYREGMPFQDVGPGCYKLRIGRDFLLFVDVRPESFDRDETAVSTLDGYTAAYSVTGKMQVQDARKAIYCARSYQQAALARTISTVRRMLNDYEAEDIKSHTQVVCDSIFDAVRNTVREIGMEVSDFRLNELRILEPPSGRSERSTGSA